MFLFLLNVLNERKEGVRQKKKKKDVYKMGGSKMKIIIKEDARVFVLDSKHDQDTLQKRLHHNQ